MTAFVSTAPAASSMITASKAAKVSRAALPSMQLAAAEALTVVPTTAVTSATSFEPVMPETSALLGFGSIVILCSVAGWVWANQVVPVSRTNLALSKRNGPVKDYLDELRVDVVNSTVTSDANKDDGANKDDDDDGDYSMTGKEIPSADRAFERWLFADWLEKKPSAASGGGRKKEPALPVLKSAKWNSGDNPVLAATGLILLGVVFTAVTERISSTSF